MKKFPRIFCVIMLSVVLGASCFMLTACPNPQPQTNDTMLISIGQTDNVFNPFFHSSAYDSEITSQTQISMLSTDKDGNPICGFDEPTVAQDFLRTVWVNDGEGAKPYGIDNEYIQTLDPDRYTADNYYTTYQFLIKNNIKFSDGQPLTIKDVVFNMYTYLDPSYIGTSTMYSTKIKGLENYRTQTPDASDDTYKGMLAGWNSEGKERIDWLKFAYPSDSSKLETNRTSISTEQKASILNDVETVRNLFWNEVVSDYNAAVIGLDGYIEQNKTNDENDATELGFTEVWEVFLYEAGFITADIDPRTGKIKLTESDTEGLIGKDGKPLGKGVKRIDYKQYANYWHDRDSLIKIVFNAKMGIYDTLNDPDAYGNYNYDSNNCVKGENGQPDSPKDGYGPKTDMLTENDKFQNGSDNAYGSNLVGTNNYEDLMWESQPLKMYLATVLDWYGTGSDARDQFVGEARSKFFANSDMPVPTIPGVKILKLENGDEFKGEMGTAKITEDQYILQIEIEKVDPQAIYNFGFVVAPMHYYSNANNASDGSFGAKDDYRSFNYPIYDAVKDDQGFYSASAEPVASDSNYQGGQWTENSKVSVGRPFANLDYFTKVLKSSNILSVPVGAGMYKVAAYNIFDENYAPEDRPTFSEFFNANVAYYVRNPYFYTTSGEGKSESESSISNCKIKYIRYQIIATSQLLSAIIKGDIDYGDPTASIENMKRLNGEGKDKGITYIDVPNNGYGYIGINPKYVPDHEIRQAIMYSMNLDYIIDYYGAMAQKLYRPVSIESWASPQRRGNPHYGEVDEPYYAYKDDNTTGALIDSLVQSAGYKGNPGSAYTKSSPTGQRKLEYTFTISGATTDHPAYKMMQESANLLNEHGFNVKVVTDNLALSKLAAGELAVWAAAWGSGIDPDMYQLYHMDSTASSTRNWGYPEILAAANNYSYEYDIIERLSDLIMEGRTTFDRTDRANTYFDAYNLVMQLAVEFPAYQRSNIYAYNSNKINSNTFLKKDEISSYRGPLSRFWEVELY